MSQLLVAWIVVQLLVIRTLSFFHPTYLAIGLSFVWVGRRMERRERSGTSGPRSRDHRPCRRPPVHSRRIEP